MVENYTASQDLIDSTHKGIIIHENGRILEVNQVLADMVNYEVSEMIGMNALDFVDEEYQELVRAKIQNSLRLNNLLV